MISKDIVSRKEVNIRYCILKFGPTAPSIAILPYAAKSLDMKLGAE